TLVLAACSGAAGSGLFVGGADGGASSGSSGTSSGSASSSGSSGTSSGESSSSSSSGASSGTSSSSSGSSRGDPTCPHHDGTDHDGDGLSSNDGDCNDCDKNINPGAFDVPGNGKDDDCSGAKDDDSPCDTGLTLTSTDAFEAAKALGLCKKTAEGDKKWGVI